MRLTNEMRTQFVCSVMRSVKRKVKHTEESILEEVSKALNMTLPQEVQDFAKKYPQQVNFTSFHVKFMDYAFKDDQGHQRWHCARAQGIYGWDTKSLNTNAQEAKWKAFRKETLDRKEMKERLMEVAKSVTTTEALEVVFPKLKKHIPKPVIEKKSLPVAATGLMNELIDLGLES